MNKILLVGNPNAGKTTLFNVLTGENQSVGNWPGVTVEKKSGQFYFKQYSVEVIDIPGLYSLDMSVSSATMDADIARKEIAKDDYDLIVNVVDVTQLERQLYLSMQLIERQKPMIIVLTMMDLAEKMGLTLDIKRLSSVLGCPVIPVDTQRDIGLQTLKEATFYDVTPNAIPYLFDDSTQQLIYTLHQAFIQCGYAQSLAYYYTFRVLSEDTDEKFFPVIQQHLQTISLSDIELHIADVKYQFIHDTVQSVVQSTTNTERARTAKIDKWVLNRWLGLPIFFSMMYLMFLFSIQIGGVFQDAIEGVSEAIFISLPTVILTLLHAPNVCILLLAHGVGGGLTTTLSFIPVIASMYLILSLFESSGYMARAAFVVDKSMRYFGLPGKAFVPMIIGFGCNVPGIMASRTLDSKRDKWLTVMMSPFMSCSARLAIYAVFVNVFFSTSGTMIVFLLYCIGIVMAVLTGFLLRRFWFTGRPAPLIMELPIYHRPSLKRMYKDMIYRVTLFIKRAVKLIVPVSALITLLSQCGFSSNGFYWVSNVNASVLVGVGKYLTPLFSTMGISSDNWPATVALITGIVAKEVVIGTLNTLYLGIGYDSTHVLTFNDIGIHLITALKTIPENMMMIFSCIQHPIAVLSKEPLLGKYVSMTTYFHSGYAVFSYLVFILLYVPCISTMVAIREETSRIWMWLSLFWSLFIAYVMACLFYQIGQHQWIFIDYSKQMIFAIILMLLIKMVFYVKKNNTYIPNA